MKSLFSTRPISMQNLPLAAALFVSLSGLALAQSNVTLDGTSGSESSSGNYSTNGGLNISLNFNAEYLVVAGGGGGAGSGSDSSAFGGGGGGAGGMVTGNTTLSSLNYNITVGAGGAGGDKTAGGTAPLAQQGKNGDASSFTNSSSGLGVNALGGGGGGRYKVQGNAGGSGGGGGGRGTGNNLRTSGGNGTTDQGNAGGASRDDDSAGRSAGGGGGGAGEVGGTGGTNVTTAGNGGAGLSSNITGNSVFYAGGGGGGAQDTIDGQTAGSGGNGGGGAGSISGNATAGTDGRGGGGGGAGTNGAGGAGGDGIVIVRYKGSSLGSIGGNVTSGNGTATGYTLHTFTTTGNSSLDLSSVNMNARLGTTLNGTISGNGGLTFNGPGNLMLAAANTFTGDTRVGSGTLTLNHSNALANSTLNMSSNDNGTVAFGLAGDQTYNIGAIGGSRNLAIGGNTLSVGGNGQGSTYEGEISGNGSLTKTGIGSLYLYGQNTYTGATSVNEGSLAVNGSLGNTAVSVGSNATLQGSGSIGGSVTITSAGTLSAGNSIESLAMGTLTLQSGANFIQEVDSSATVGTQADLVVVNGDLNIANEAVSLTLTDLAGSWNWTENTKLTMINYSGVWNGGLFIMNGDVLEDDSIISWNTSAVMGWRINYNDTTGGSNYSSEQTLSKFVTLTAVPEPTVLTLGSLGALLLLRRRRA